MRIAVRSLWAEPRVPDPPTRVWRDWALVAVLVPLAVLEVILREDLVWRPVALVLLNASAAPMVLVGLGAAVAIRWLVRDRHGPTLVAGALGAVVVVASLGFVLNDGLGNRWVSESNQWANQQVPEFEFGLDLILDGLERLLTMTDTSGFDR